MLEDSRDEFLLREVLEPWWGREVYEEWRQEASTERVAILHALLARGTPLWDTEPDGDRIGEGPEVWCDALALYCDAFGADPWTVYDTVPFPFFMRLLPEARRTIGRRSWRAAEVVIIPHTSKEERAKIMRKIQREAGLQLEGDLPAGDATEAEIAESRAELDRLFGVAKPEAEA